MIQKYELLQISKVIKQHRDLTDISMFVMELFDNIELEPFFLSYEMTLLLYNILLNVNNDFSYWFDKKRSAKIKQNLVLIMAKLYNKELSPPEMAKLMDDVRYIETHKTYTYISDALWMAYSQVAQTQQTKGQIKRKGKEKVKEKKYKSVNEFRQRIKNNINNKLNRTTNVGNDVAIKMTKHNTKQLIYNGIDLITLLKYLPISKKIILIIMLTL